MAHNRSPKVSWVPVHDNISASTPEQQEAPEQKRNRSNSAFTPRPGKLVQKRGENPPQVRKKIGCIICEGVEECYLCWVVGRCVASDILADIFVVVVCVLHCCLCTSLACRKFLPLEIWAAFRRGDSSVVESTLPSQLIDF